MSAKNFVKKQQQQFTQQKQYGGELKSDYYRSADQNSDHPLSKINYCIDFIEKTCQKGMNCKKRHILYQQLRKELKCIQPPYKKHLCTVYESNQKCPKSKYLCLFAHGEDDIWNTRYQEKKAERINATDVDERLRNQNKQSPPVQKAKPQQQQQEDLIQKIIRMKKEESLPNNNNNKKNDLVKNQINKEEKSKGDQKNKNQLPKQSTIPSNQNSHKPKQENNPVPTHSRNNQRQRNRVHEVNPQQVEQRNSKRQNFKQSLIKVPQQEKQQQKQQKSNNGHGKDEMTDQEFEEYLLSLREEQLMNENDDRDVDDLEDSSDLEDDENNVEDDENDVDEDEEDVDGEDIDDDEDDEDYNPDEEGTSNSSDGKNDLFISEKPNKNQNKKQSSKEQKDNEEESWESEEDEEEEEYEDIKEKKDSTKPKKQTKQNENQNYNDFDKIDWNKVDPDKMTTQQLMQINAGIMKHYDNNNSQEDEEDDETYEDNNSSKEYNQLDEQKLNEERNKRKQERVEQRKRKKEEKKQQKQQEKYDNINSNNNNNNNNVNNNKNNQKQQQQQQQQKNTININNNVQQQQQIPQFGQNKEQLFQLDQLEIFCFCYFNTEKDLKNWKEIILGVFFDLQIPKNALIITEDQRCEGEHGIIIKVKSLKVVCLQLLRINIFKNPKLKILFKILPNPDSQITFSKQIIANKKLNEYSFVGQDGQTYILFNSIIDHSESENLEFKNYDFRNYYENTRKLEEVITGMLNREEFENEEFYKKEEYSGRIFLGVKDSTRQFVGSCTTNNYHESFFTFLAKRLRDCSPPIKSNLFSRDEYRLVIPGENENEFFPIIDMKIFVINVQKPEKNTIYATSSGLYYQKIEEGNWPMSACSLYEKKENKYITEEKFKTALQQLDRRYFFVMAKMANQNALIQSDIYHVEESHD